MILSGRHAQAMVTVRARSSVVRLFVRAAFQAAAIVTADARMIASCEDNLHSLFIGHRNHFNYYYVCMCCACECFCRSSNGSWAPTLLLLLLVDGWMQTNVGVCESLSASCVVYEGCTGACAPIDLPVCGADGITYANRSAVTVRLIEPVTHSTISMVKLSIYETIHRRQP